MASAALELIITTKDNASGPIGKTAAAVTNLGKQAEHTHGLLSAMVTGVGFGAISAGITAVSAGFHALGGFIGDSIQESRDAAAGLAQTEAVIKSTGAAAGVTAQQIVDMAGALSHATLFTDDAIQADQNLLLTFTNLKNGVGAGNDIFTQATKVSLDLAQAMGTDASGGAIQLGKALNDPTAGISALTRVGVTFTDQQKEQIKTLQDSGNMMGAQKVILAELNKEFGGSAEAAMQADGGFHLFQQRMDDVKQTIGDALQPALTSLMGFMAGPGLDAVEALGGGIARWLSGTAVPAIIGFTSVLGDLGRYIGAVVDDGDTLNDWLSHLPGWLQPIAKIGGDVITALQGIGGAVKDAIAGFASGDFSGLTIDLSGMFGDIDTSVITDALQAVREGFGLARDSLITFQQAITGTWVDDATGTILPLHEAIGNIGLIAHEVFDWLVTTGIPDLSTAFSAAMPGNIQLIQDLAAAMTGLQGTSRATSDSIKTDINAWFDPNANPAVWINVVAQSFTWLGVQTHAVLVLAGSDLQVFWGQIQSIGGSIGGVLSTIGASFSTFGTNVAATARLAGSDFSVFASQVQAIGATVGGFMGTLGANFAAFGAQVSATVHLAGADVASVFASIGASATSLAATIGGVATAAWSVFYNAVQTANANAVAAMNSIGAAASTMAAAIGTGINTAIGFIASLPGRAAAAVGDLSGVLIAAGSSLIGGLISGIQSKFAAVQATLGSLTKMLPSWKGPADVDAKLLYDNGRIIIGGFVQGLNDSFPQVKTSLGTLTSAIAIQFAQGIQAGAANMTAATTGAVHGALDAAHAVLTGATFANPLHFLAPDQKTLDQIGASFSGSGATIGMHFTEGMKLGALAAMPGLLTTMRQSTDSLIQEIVGFIDSGDTTSTLNATGAAAINALLAGMNTRTDLAPVLPQLAAGFAGIAGAAKTATAATTRATDDMLDHIKLLGGVSLDAMTSYNGAQDPLTYLTPAMREIPTWTGYVKDLGDGLSLLGPRTDWMAGTAHDASDLGNGLHLLGDQTPAVQNLGNGLTLLGDQWSRMGAVASQAGQDLGDGLRLLGDQTPAVQDLGDGLTLLGDQWSRQAATMTDLAPVLPQIAAGYAGVADAAKTAAAATVRATDDMLDHIKLLGGASLDAMGGFTGGGASGGGALSYLDGAGGLGGSADYAKQAGTDAGMGFGDGWQKGIEQIGPVFQDTTRLTFQQLHDVVLLPWQTQTNDFFSGAGFGFIGQASTGINSAGNGLATSAGNVGGAAGAALVSSMRGNLGGVDQFVQAVNVSLSHIEREVTIHVKTVYDP